ncbi:hypothetical protein LMH87_003200 [Akanthomyces muscarius]|uniref:Uncharacterized protein n=1 Tax=Akanthomyces muscarius TaxID=2231603 RepID=A0A9W8Q241_AKAMU|nr:hypothetical protein LMH87_003200 [Akanthomyces muscarius]KAJ4144310.1 hypothetical protein LMH87_003200 [Akanthomyces muscarius]
MHFAAVVSIVAATIMAASRVCPDERHGYSACCTLNPSTGRYRCRILLIPPEDIDTFVGECRETNREAKCCQGRSRLAEYTCVDPSTV